MSEAIREDTTYYRISNFWKQDSSIDQIL